MVTPQRRRNLARNGWTIATASDARASGSRYAPPTAMRAGLPRPINAAPITRVR